MAYINLYLTTGQTLSKDDVVSTGLLFNKKFPTKWTNASMPTLENLLCNLVKYENQPVLYEQRNKANVMPRYNPMNLGHKKLIDKDSGVLWKLIRMNLVKHNPGKNPYFLKEHEELITSEFKSTNGVIEFAKLLGITKKKIYEVEGSHHVILKVPKKEKLVDYKDSKLSEHLEDLMSEYNNFLQSYSIICDAEKYTDIKLRRTFRDIDGNGSLLYGSRAGSYWHNVKRAKRKKTLRINRSKYASIDLVSSQLNFLYAYRFKTKLSQEDRYAVPGYEGTTNRKFVKGMTNIMLNTRNSRKANGGFLNWLDDEDRRYLKKIYHNNPLDLFQLQRDIRKHHKEIANLFYQPKIGMNLQFLEASFIFEVALQCCRQGVPALTLHDEIMVPHADKDIAEMILNGTPLNKRLYKAIF